MIVGEGNKIPLSVVAHFGVKGMKWGQRKAGTSTHPTYTPRKQANDRQQHGKRAVARINDRLNQGETRDQALHREDVRNARQRLASAGAVYAAIMLLSHGSARVSDIAEANRASARDKTISIGVTAAKTSFVKPHRGVHNITTMK